MEELTVADEPPKQDESAHVEDEETPNGGNDRRNTVIEWVLTLGIAFLVGWTFHMFVARSYVIPSESMVPTLEVGDLLIGESVTSESHDPDIGDIVTFYSPKGDGTTLIKRVIAKGGSTIDLRDGDVYVDGEKLDEPYVHGQDTEPLYEYSDISYPYTVPEDSVFVMGDNRGNSADSRVFGAVPESELTSNIIWRFWPIDEIGNPEE